MIFSCCCFSLPLVYRLITHVRFFLPPPLPPLLIRFGAKQTSSAPPWVRLPCSQGWTPVTRCGCDRCSRPCAPRPCSLARDSRPSSHSQQMPAMQSLMFSYRYVIQSVTVTASELVIPLIAIVNEIASCFPAHSLSLPFPHPFPLFPFICAVREQPPHAAHCSVSP